MRLMVVGLLIASALSACGTATANGTGAAPAGGIAVERAWVRPASAASAAASSDMGGHDMTGAADTETNGPTSAGYMTLTNGGAQADRLVAVSSDVAGEVQMHMSTNKDNVMSMQQVQAIDVPANGTVALEPGSYHLMLLDLKRDLVAGETVKLALRFERAGTVEVEASVRDAAP